MVSSRLFCSPKDVSYISFIGRKDGLYFFYNDFLDKVTIVPGPRGGFRLRDDLTSRVEILGAQILKEEKNIL